MASSRGASASGPASRSPASASASARCSCWASPRPCRPIVAAGCFGVGIGGILTVLPLAWADYFGRASFGAIRGVALTMQVTAQASGPLLSGVLRDLTGTYVAAVRLLCGAVRSLAVGIALLTRAVRLPARG